jgi:hypothetical protein
MKPSNTNTQEIERAIERGNEAASAEQSADLAALQAAANDGGDQLAGAAAVEPAGPDLAAELAGLVSVAVAALGPMFPSLRATYTPDVTQAAAGAIAAVCEKRGWLSGGLLGNWGEEIACVAIVGPLALQTYQGIRADIETRKPKAAQRIAAEPGQASPAAPGKGVQFGTVAAEAAA